MKVSKDVTLKAWAMYDGWCLNDKLDVLSDEDWERLDTCLTDIYPDGVDTVHLNDILRFEDDWLAEMLGYDSWEQLLSEREG